MDQISAESVAMRMNSRALLAAALSGLILSACVSGPVGNTAVPEPAREVDLKRYMGLWYEQARYEHRFEKDCEGVTARYNLLRDGTVEVINTCRDKAVDGEARVAQGKAKPVGDPKGAKFKVSFFGPFTGDYWVLDHAPDYSWAIVGEGSGKYLWILTRKAVLTEAERTALIGRTKAMGYDVSMLRITQQPPA